MFFKKTKYHLMNVADSREFEDTGWMLNDPACGSPSLIRAVYENRHFNPRDELDGIYRYSDWLPISRTLRRSCAPVTYKSKGLAAFLRLSSTSTPMPFDVNGSYGHTPRQQYDCRSPATRCSLGMMPISGHRSHDSGGCGE